MKKEFGYYVMNSTEFDNWMKKYNAIMDDPNSTPNLLDQVEKLNNVIVIED